MAGVLYCQIGQIPTIPDETRIIVVAQVLSLFRQEKFLSIIISDSTSSAQATLYQHKSQYQQFKLPSIGDTIQILGTCLTKPMASNQKQKHFLKIKIERWRLISFDEELELHQKILAATNKRAEKKLLEEVVILKKKIRIKEKTFSDKEMVDIRSLIFSYLYIIFQNNSDIHSYLFVPLMVRNHSLSKEYAKDNEIPQKSMQEAISKNLMFLLSQQILELKPQQPGDISSSSPQQYVIKKRFFERLVVDIEEYVYQKKNTGATLQQVTSAMNQKMGRLKEEDYLFNFKFIQKILMDLIKQFRIYKTSDKKIYPYSH